MNILIAGCGYVGHATAVRLLNNGHRVWALSRSARSETADLRLITADLNSPEDFELPSALDRILITIAAPARTETSYTTTYIDAIGALLQKLDSAYPSRVIFTSSTSVFGQTTGEWVDENSLANAQHFTGAIMRAAERLLDACPFESVSVRLGGIYGPGRTRLLRAVRDSELNTPAGGPYFTNRIHRDDCAGALVHLTELPHVDGLYVCVDSDPAPVDVVHRDLAQILGVSAPKRGLKGARQRTNKRCCNDRLLASGYRLRYPSFRDGYRRLLQEI